MKKPDEEGGLMYQQLRKFINVIVSKIQAKLEAMSKDLSLDCKNARFGVENWGSSSKEEEGIFSCLAR